MELNELELNKKELIDNPELHEYTIGYIKESFNAKRFSNIEFKGFVEFDFDFDTTKWSYYGHVSENEDKIYLPIKYLEYDKSIDSELIEIEEFIENKKREYNRNSVNNIEYSKEEIKNLFFPNIDLSNPNKYLEEFKYLIYICGPDDGSKYLRFNSEESRDKFLNKILSFENYEDVFTYEEENYLLFDLN